VQSFRPRDSASSLFNCMVALQDSIPSTRPVEAYIAYTFNAISAPLLIVLVIVGAEIEAGLIKADRLPRFVLAEQVTALF